MGTDSSVGVGVQFLIGPDGVPFKRYSPKLDFKSLTDDIELLLNLDVKAEKQL